MKKLFLFVVWAFVVAYAPLQAQSLDEVKREMKPKMISVDAPDFTLKDLDGNVVSLSGLKGKVVVLDFWATWCGPCVQSFPGVRKTVDKYKQDANVVFLFIATAEDPNRREERLKKFLTKKKYDFRVLVDENDQAAQKFSVDGIPMKFVINPAGKVCFVSSGYNGSTDGTATELEAMVELAKDSK